MFMGPQYGVASCHSVGTDSCEVALRFLENLCTPEFKHFI